MKRFLPHNWLPKSLLAQVMASAMLALLVAQIVGAFFIFKAGEDRLEASALSELTFHISIGGEDPDRFAPRPRRGDRANRGDPGARREPPGARRPSDLEFSQPVARLPRHLRYHTGEQSEVALSDANTQSTRAKRLTESLQEEGIEPAIVAVEVRRAGVDPELLAFAQDHPRLNALMGWRKRGIYVASVQREPGGAWETVRAFERKPPKQAVGVLIFQTILIYAFLGTILYFVLRRITRPLALLTTRVDAFSKAPDHAVRLEETGPSDTRQLIRAHNAMEARIAALLDEKDVMLGAIGHDLKTPLAALRVRIESVPDETQRARMADSIEDITRTLDDILSLARVGRGSNGAEAFEAVDITALTDSVVEEFEDLGEPVTFEAPEGGSPRLVASVQVTWLKRALRNLVSNAVRYGESAHVSVHAADGALTLRVEDRGPGIPEDQIADMLEPFTRGDASRNRSTGGAGLGLTLARAIAEAHKGTLELSNRPEGGLRAEIRIPV